MTAVETGTLNLAWSANFVAGLVAAGVRDIVLSPGSRSTPLTLACLRHPALHCEVVLDERAAAFFALGLARAGGQPVALVCTSGTAAANWLPAVVEANRSGVPLILCTADRPPELQGWDANQTIDQTHLFGTQVRAFHAPGTPSADVDPAWLIQLACRAVTESRWPSPGPVHVNLAFREPLLPASPAFDFPELPPLPATVPPLHAAPAEISSLAAQLAAGDGVIVGGEGPYPPGFADAVAALAAALDCPILAEPLSGLRFGRHDRQRICTRYARWLRRAPLIPQGTRWVLRFGRFPVTRPLQQWLAGIGTHFLVEGYARWSDPLHRVLHPVRGDEREVCAALCAALPEITDSTWAARFAAAEAAVIPNELRHQPPEGELLARLCGALPDGTRFFCGNSTPIRDLDACSGTGATRIEFHANRGASGIDGNVATAAGIAATAPTVAVIGDLTAQHDLGALALMRDRPLALIVVNNGGGGIFDFLPQATLPEFERGWLTPQQLDFASAAAAFGIDYRHATDPEQAVALALQALLEQRPCLIEMPVDRQSSLKKRQAAENSGPV